MLLSTLFRISKVIIPCLLAGYAYAFDSSQAYNTITFSYIDNAYVKQTFVLSGTQQSTATSFKLTVDAKDGGGRPTHNLDGTCAAYCTQFDTAQIQIIAYNASGSIVSTKSVSQNLKNWGSNAGWSAGPGDNQFDWTQMSVSVTAADVGGSFSNVARIEVRLVNQNEGSYWNGNYGVQFRTPTLQVDGTGSNLLYNSEFGVDSTGVRAQGWALSYSSYNTCSGNASSQACVTTEQSVTANMWGGGEDPNGGTVNSQPGGYSSVLTSDNADTAASGGDISSGGGSSTPPPAPTPVYSSSITQQQSARRASNLAETTGHQANVNIHGNDNEITIQQISSGHFVSVDVNGNTNSVDILQTTTSGARHYMETTVIGNNNNLILQQRETSKNMFVGVDGNNNNLSVNQKGTGNHYLDVQLLGDNHTAGIIQDGSGNHNATVRLENGGGAWNFQLNQSGTTNNTYSLPHGMSDGSTVNGVCNAPAGCNLIVNQQ